MGRSALFCRIDIVYNLRINAICAANTCLLSLLFSGKLFPKRIAHITFRVATFGLIVFFVTISHFFKKHFGLSFSTLASVKQALYNRDTPLAALRGMSPTIFCVANNLLDLFCVSGGAKVYKNGRFESEHFYAKKEQ